MATDLKIYDTIRKSKLTSSQKMVCCAGINRDWGVAWMAEYLGVDKVSVYRAISAIEKSELVTVIKTDSGYRFTPNGWSTERHLYAG